MEAEGGSPDNGGQREVLRAVERVKQGDASAMRVLLDALADRGPSVPRLASDLLVSLGPSVAEAVLAVLEDSSAPHSQRQYASRTAALLGGERATRTLIRLVLDPEEDLRLRRDIAFRLPRTESPEVVEPLSALATSSDGDPELRWHAIESLGECGGSSAVAALHTVLSTPDVRFLTERGQNELANVRRLEQDATGSLKDEFTRVRIESERGRSLHYQVHMALDKAEQSS